MWFFEARLGVPGWGHLWGRPSLLPACGKEAPEERGPRWGARAGLEMCLPPALGEAWVAEALPADNRLWGRWWSSPGKWSGV